MLDSGCSNGCHFWADSLLPRRARRRHRKDMYVLHKTTALRQATPAHESRTSYVLELGVFSIANGAVISSLMRYGLTHPAGCAPPDFPAKMETRIGDSRDTGIGVLDGPVRIKEICSCGRTDPRCPKWNSAGTSFVLGTFVSQILKQEISSVWFAGLGEFLAQSSAASPTI